MKRNPKFQTLNPKRISMSNLGFRVLMLELVLSLCLCGHLYAQTPSLTTVKDTVYRSDGTPASGTVVITWPAFVTGDSKAVFGGTKTLPLTNGALAVGLAPNSGATPSGTSYQVKYFQSGGVFFEETWVVPTSSPLANPAQPVSVTQAGTPGSTTYYYWCTATNANGETLLSPSRITTASNATLSGTNYNVITCATVSGATGYKAYRTTTATAPSGTGLYLVGSSATTTINDQSNTLQSATIPALNTTDPRTLSAVRVTAAPSSTVTLAASQVQGNAIVSNPSATQTIIAPAGTGIPLQVKGRSGNASNVVEVYDNAGTPILQGLLSAAGRWKLGDTTGASAFGTYFLGIARTTSYVRNGGTGLPAGLVGYSEDSGTTAGDNAWYGMVGASEYTGSGVASAKIHIGSGGFARHSGSGTLFQAVGAEGQGQNSGSGPLTNAIGGFFVVAISGTGGVTNGIGLSIGSPTNTMAAAYVNNYGLKIENMAGFGSTVNDSINVGTGSVNFSAATNLRVPTAAGLSPTTSGHIAYDSTSHTLEWGANGSNRTAASLEAVETFSGAKTFTTNITAPLVIGGTGTTSTLSLRSTSGVGATGADILFQTGNNGATEAARIVNNGDFGILNTDPTTPLSGQFSLQGLAVGNTSGSYGISILSSSSSTLSSLRFTDGGSSLWDQGSLVYNHSTDTMSVSTARGTRLTIGPTGTATMIQDTPGTTVLNLQTTATNDDPTMQVRQNRVATTDATQTTLDTIAITASRTYCIQSTVVARRTGGSAGTADEGAGYDKKACYTTKAGTVTLLGSIATVIEVEDQAGWDFTFSVSGANVLLRVTGATNNNVTWHSTVTVSYVGT